jgi:hypothetical protein
MKTAIVSFALLAAFTSLASADPIDAASRTDHDAASRTQHGRDRDHAYLALGVELGNSDRHSNMGAAADLGYHLGDTPLWVHAHAAWGGEILDSETWQLRAGIEARKCRGLACGYAGLDLGYQRDHMSEFFAMPSQMETAHDLVIAPRAGLEFGNALKVRLGVELPQFVRLDRRETVHGVNMNLGVGYTF